MSIYQALPNSVIFKLLPLPVADVRTAVVKGGGKMADSGSVMFNFQRQGQIYVKGSASTEEEVSCKTT